MITETVYLGHDNGIDLQLKADGVITNLEAITRVQIKDSTCLLTIDSLISPGAFDWSVGNGVLILKVGLEAVPPGTYTAYLIIYDISNPDGVVWDKFKINFKSLC